MKLSKCFFGQTRSFAPDFKTASTSLPRTLSIHVCRHRSQTGPVCANREWWIGGFSSRSTVRRSWSKWQQWIRVGKSIESDPCGCAAYTRLFVALPGSMVSAAFKDKIDLLALCRWEETQAIVGLVWIPLG